MRCRRHFRTSHPWLGPKTAGIHAGRPSGVRMRVACEASRRSKAEDPGSQMRTSASADGPLPLTFLAPQQPPASGNPGGAAAMDGRRFRTEAGGRVRKFLRHPHTLSDLSRKVLSFGYFSLHQQRKVTRRKAKALRPKGVWSRPPMRERHCPGAPVCGLGMTCSSDVSSNPADLESAASKRKSPPMAGFSVLHNAAQFSALIFRSI
jgi:hypothetical protein